MCEEEELLARLGARSMFSPVNTDFQGQQYKTEVHGIGPGSQGPCKNNAWLAA